MSIESKILKILQEKRKIQKLDNKFKSNRKERTRHLIQLGLIFSILGLENENQDVLLAFTSEYLKLSDDKKEILKIKGQEIRKRIKENI